MPSSPSRLRARGDTITTRFPARETGVTSRSDALLSTFISIPLRSIRPAPKGIPWGQDGTTLLVRREPNLSMRDNGRTRSGLHIQPEGSGVSWEPDQRRIRSNHRLSAA